MKRTEVQKLKGKNAVELAADIEKTRKELEQMRFDMASGKVKNVQMIREAKKKVARMLTFIKQKNNE